MEYASRGVATAGLTTGIIGATMGAANSGLLDNLFGGRRCGNGGNDGNWGGVDRYELIMALQMAHKDMEISYWRGQDEANRKISDTYARLEGKIDHLDHEFQRNKEAHDGDRQVLHDMAREEYTHAKHLCRMLKAHGVETDHHELWEQAKAALW